MNSENIKSLLLFCIFLVSGTSYAIPELRSPLTDEAHLLGSEEVAEINRLLWQIQDSGKAQMAIVIVRELEGLPIETYSQQVFEAWKLGIKGDDRGLLLVITIKERKIRFEVGYGLEGILTDLTTKSISDSFIRPYFRENRFGEGILAAIEEVARKLQIPLEELSDRRPPSEDTVSSWYLGFFIIFIFLAFLTRRRLFYGRGQPYWYSGGGPFNSNDSFSGNSDIFRGGGGSFGGGGSTSDW